MKKIQLFSFFLLFFATQSAMAQTSAMRMEGKVHFNFSHESLTLGVERIVNGDEYGVSGSLKLAVYFSKQPYSGTGTIDGIKVFEAPTYEVEAGYYRGGVELTREWLRKPADGTYYVIVLLLEYDQRDERYYIVSSKNFSEKTSISYNAFFSGYWDVD